MLYPTFSDLCSKLCTILGDLGRVLVQQLQTIFQGLATPDDMGRLFGALE